MNSEVTVALISAVVTVCNIVFTTLSNEITRKKVAKTAIDSKQDKELTLVKGGLQALLRAEIIRERDKRIERGYCPIYAKEALTKEYNAYHALGGNDVATQLYNECIALPDKDKEDNDEH